MFRIQWLNPLLLVGLLACQPVDEALPSASATAFFPLELGTVRHFQVDSIVWVATPRGLRRDTIRTWVQERLSDTLRSLSGEKLWRVERRECRDTTQPWLLRQVFWETATPTGWHRQEGAWVLQWAVFPLQKGIQWSFTPRNAPQQTLRLGNQEVAPYPDLRAALVFFDQPWTAPSGQNHPHCLQIRLQGPRNDLAQREGFAIFARDHGLIYRTFTALNTPCTTCAPQSWYDKAQSGFKVEEIRLD